MGATNIIVQVRGANLKDAFNEAQKEAEDEYGTDSYNGEINNCVLVGDRTAQLKNKSYDAIYEWVDDNLSKREVVGICLQKPVSNSNLIKSTVKNIPQKGARKWVTKYQARTKWGGQLLNISENTQAEAVKKVRSYIETKALAEPVQIFITKELEKGNVLCVEVNYKRSKKESSGRYIFAGIAPC